MSRCGIIILAAGGSARLGRPKQALAVDGEPLLARITRAAVASRASEVLVVLGAHAQECMEILDGLGARTVINPGWREGIAFSIRAGVQNLSPGLDAAMILLCDQPRVSMESINALLSLQGSSIIASSYGGSLGPPAIFPVEFFPELMALEGDQGAKKIFSSHPDELIAVPFPEGEIDIDTPADYERLLS